MLCVAAFGLFLLGSSPMVAASEQPPNILFILADDLGYNEVGFNNNTRGLVTPNLDRLAGEGVRLTNYYVQPMCSPTRSSLMTGRYAARLGTQSNVIFWNTPWCPDLGETYLAENLRDAGYKTAMFGKWHLGMFMEACTPTARGFDEHEGYYQGCESYWTHEADECGAAPPKNMSLVGYDWFRNGVVNFDDNATYSADLLSAATSDYIRKRADDPTPWFIYMPLQNIHAPYVAKPTDPPRCGKDLHNNEICGMIAAMDDAVGKVVSALKATSQLNNTVIVFSSDNGAPAAPAPTADQRNYPFRGFKSQVWEGGVKAAGFVWSERLESKARASPELFHVTDWLPTLVALAGGNTTRNRALDGHDIWHSLSTGAPSPRSEMLYNINPLAGQQIQHASAIRHGDIKLVIDSSSSKPVSLLYDLSKDPQEMVNLYGHPAYSKVQHALEQRLTTLTHEAAPPMVWEQPYQGDDYWCAHCALGTPREEKGVAVWEPWMRKPEK